MCISKHCCLHPRGLIWKLSSQSAVIMCPFAYCFHSSFKSFHSALPFTVYSVLPWTSYQFNYGVPSLKYRSIAVDYTSPQWPTAIIENVGLNKYKGTQISSCRNTEWTFHSRLTLWIRSTSIDACESETEAMHWVLLFTQCPVWELLGQSMFWLQYCPSVHQPHSGSPLSVHSLQLV